MRVHELKLCLIWLLPEFKACDLWVIMNTSFLGSKAPASYGRFALTPRKIEYLNCYSPSCLWLYCKRKKIDFWFQLRHTQSYGYLRWVHDYAHLFQLHAWNFGRLINIFFLSSAFHNLYTNSSVVFQNKEKKNLCHLESYVAYVGIKQQTNIERESNNSKIRQKSNKINVDIKQCLQYNTTQASRLLQTIATNKLDGCISTDLFTRSS